MHASTVAAVLGGGGTGSPVLTPQPDYWPNVILSLPMQADFNDVSSFAKTPNDTGGNTVSGGWGNFDGASDVEFAMFNEFSLACKRFSIETTVNFDTVASTQVIAAVYRNTTNERSWVLQFEPAGNLVLALIDGVSTQLSVSRAWSPSAGIDYHVAACVDDDNVYLFVDGVRLGAVATGALDADFREFDQTIRIAALYSNGETSIFDGKMKHLRIISGEAIYTANFTPPPAAHPTSGAALPSAPSPTPANVELDVPMFADFDDDSSNAHTPSDTGGLSIVSNRGDFDGTGDIEYADDASFELSGASAFCIEAQVEWDSLASLPQYIASKLTSSGTNRAWAIRQLSASVLEYFEYSSGSSTPVQFVKAKFTAATATEYHVAVTYDGSTLRVWVEGRLLSARSSIGVFDNATVVAIGGRQTTEYLDGKMRDFRITVGEEIYTENFQPPA